MVINAVCLKCKRIYPVDEQYAGQTFSCQTCGSPFTVPSAGVMQAPAAPAGEYSPAQTVGYAGTIRGEVSRDRQMASRICIALSILGYLGFGCLGCLGIVLLAGANPALGVVSVLMWIGAVVAAGIATTYLICGLRIKKGGRVTPIVAMVVGGVNGLGSLLLLVSSMVQLAMKGGAVAPPGAAGMAGYYFIGMGIHVLFLIGIGQLIYHCVRILKEPRGGY